LQAQAQTSRRIRTVIIDQFDKLVPERHSQSDASNSKSISVALNSLAKELDAAIFVLIQVNARNKKNSSERYTKNDIFGTAGPEQDAGQIWLMQRVPETTWSDDGELPLEVTFEVGRAGVNGMHPMTHIGPSSTIVSGHNREGF
jgi:replicative DNA helicase